jgi:hypothetical protein
MTLRTKIFLITTLIILLIQSLNSVLEVAFLYGHLKETRIHTFRTVGREMKRKLEKSLAFGKPLKTLNFDRLLQGLMPNKLEVFIITDENGKRIAELETPNPSAQSSGDKTPDQTAKESYRIQIPIENNDRVVGYMQMSLSGKAIRSEISSIIESSVYNSLAIILFVLPVLYAVLIWRVDRPYAGQIKTLTTAFELRDDQTLKKEGIEPDNLISAEKTAWTILEAPFYEQDPEMYVTSDAVNGFPKPDDSSKT